MGVCLSVTELIQYKEKINFNDFHTMCSINNWIAKIWANQFEFYQLLPTDLKISYIHFHHQSCGKYFNFKKSLGLSSKDLWLGIQSSDLLSKARRFTYEM